MIFWSDKELNEGLVLHWAELVYGGKKDDYYLHSCTEVLNPGGLEI